MRKLLIPSLFLVLAGGIPAFGAPLIINEWNAVGAGKVLNSSGTDTFFNANYVAPTGNGGNWVELVVTQDHLDIRGWSLAWSNADPDSGDVTFTNNALWSDVRSGTIITLREDDTGDDANAVGARASDVSFNPGSNDFWLEINVDDALYIVKNGFKVDNDDWVGSIYDDTPSLLQGPLGESAGPWSGGGLGSTEVGALQANPTAAAILAGYKDVTYSSYGAPNYLTTAGTVVQDFSALRAWVPEPSSFVLAALAACGAAVVAVRRHRRR